MAYEPKIIPVVTGEAAERFLEQAHLDETVNRGSIDISDYMKVVKEILEKSEDERRKNQQC